MHYNKVSFIQKGKFMHSCKQISTVAEYLNVAFRFCKRKGNTFNCTKKPVKWVGNFGRLTVKLHAHPK